MSNTTLSDELLAIQEAWEICDKCRELITKNDSTPYHFYQDPINDSAVIALYGAKEYLRRQAIHLTTGGPNE